MAALCGSGLLPPGWPNWWAFLRAAASGVFGGPVLPFFFSAIICVRVVLRYVEPLNLVQSYYFFAKYANLFAFFLRFAAKIYINTHYRLYAPPRKKKYISIYRYFF